MGVVSREDVVSALGAIEAARVDEIVAVGVDNVEFAEARVWFAQNKVLVEIGNHPRHPAGRVGRVVEILERIDAEQGLSPFGEATLVPEPTPDARSRR
jgi:hypothetical protein